MKKSVKLITLLTALALIAGLAVGCSNDTPDASASSPDAVSASPTAAAPDNSGDATGDGSDAPVEKAYFPLDEPASISIWMSYPPIFSGLADNGPEDFAFYQEAERQTNVNIDWSTASYITASDSFSVMLAGGEYTDIIWSMSSYYKGSFDSAIEGDLIINHSDYIRQYMDDMVTLFDSNDQYWKDITTDGGNIAYISMVNPLDVTLVTGGWAINTDLLAMTDISLKPEEINTLEEWETVATALQQQAGVEHPIWLPYTGYYYGSSIGSAFETSITFQSRAGAYSPFFYNGSGELEFGGISEGYRQYLTLMHDWYEKGFIDPDFISKTESDQYAQEDDILNRKVAMFRTNNNYINYDAFRGTDSEVNLAALPDPVLYDGQVLTIGEPITTVAPIGSGSVTTSCDPEKYELIFEWFDYFFSDAGYLLVNYGVENVSYEFDASGAPHYTDAILSPGNFSQNTMISYYTGGGTLNVGLANYDKYDDLYNDLQKTSSEVWGSGGHNKSSTMSMYISLTEEELSVYSFIMNDIFTYVAEQTVAFIRGDRSLSEYDDYVAVIRGRDIDSVIDIMAAAQTRYENR